MIIQTYEYWNDTVKLNLLCGSHFMFFYYREDDFFLIY